MEFAALVLACAPWVAPATMEAVIKTESAFQPWAIGINGGAKLQRQPASKEEAVVTAEWLIGKGFNIDLGLGQVNSRNLAKTGLSVEDAFDPCKNVAAAATILHWNYQAAKDRVQGEQPALHAALSAYNTGSFTKGLANGYVQKVVNNAIPGQGIATSRPASQPIPLLSTQTTGFIASKPTPGKTAAPAVVLAAERVGEGAAMQVPREKPVAVYESAAPNVLVY